MKFIIVLILIFVTFNNNFIISTTTTNDIGNINYKNRNYINSQDFQDISVFMKEQCYDIAGSKIKDEKMTAIFCQFIDHLLDHDYEIILSNYLESKRDLNLIKLSLEDVIKQKFYKKVEKEHYLEDLFLDSLKSTTNQFLNKKKKDEL